MGDYLREGLEFDFKRLISAGAMGGLVGSIRGPLEDPDINDLVEKMREEKP